MTLPPPVPPGAPPFLTAVEFTARYSNIRAELIKGRVKELSVPFARHGLICSRIDRLIGNRVDTHDLGQTMSNDTWILTNRDPDTVRGADVCYFSYERLPKGPIPEGLLSVAPDLVVEVRAPSDRWTEIFAKITDYLTAGVRVVIVLDPDTETASVYRPELLQQIYQKTDLLVLPDVLPGFSVAVQRLFV